MELSSPRVTGAVCKPAGPGQACVCPAGSAEPQLSFKHGTRSQLSLARVTLVAAGRGLRYH